MCTFTPAMFFLITHILYVCLRFESANIKLYFIFKPGVKSAPLPTLIGTQHFLLCNPLYLCNYVLQITVRITT